MRYYVLVPAFSVLGAENTEVDARNMEYLCILLWAALAQSTPIPFILTLHVNHQG